VFAGRENQWKAWPANTASKAASGAGMRSAVPAQAAGRVHQAVEARRWKLLRWKTIGAMSGFIASDSTRSRMIS
jgi:hypothetical protein